MAGPGPPAPSPPSSDPRPTDDTTSACCRCDDYSKEITANAGSRYYQRPSATGGPFDPVVRYRLDVRLKTDQKILLTVRVKLLPDPSVSAAAAARAQTLMNQAIMVIWNPALRMIRVEDPKCPPTTMVVNYDVQWVNSGAHYILALHEFWDRDYVAGNVLDAGANTNAITYAHEYGHFHGLPDEYSYVPSGSQQIVYKRPDGTSDPPLTGTLLMPPTVPTASLMSSSNYGVTRLTTRHSYNIAIEVQDLLTQKLRRTIRCTSL